MSDISKIIADALQLHAKKASNDMTAADAKSAVPVVAKEVNAVVTNLQNAEPLWRSRVMVGLVISLALKAAALAGWATDTLDAEAVTTQVMLLVSVAGDLYAMYGRTVPNKPIGM